MKKKLSYRDKLIELAYIYNVKEIQDYVKRRKNLTTGQIELILKKNKIIIPKEFKTSFFKENFVKPISKAALAAGADGLIIEAHPEPDNSISDPAQAINYETLKLIFNNDESVVFCLSCVLSQ